MREQGVADSRDDTVGLTPPPPPALAAELCSPGRLGAEVSHQEAAGLGAIDALDRGRGSDVGMVSQLRGDQEQAAAATGAQAATHQDGGDDTHPTGHSSDHVAYEAAEEPVVPDLPRSREEAEEQAASHVAPLRPRPSHGATRTRRGRSFAKTTEPAHASAAAAAAGSAAAVADDGTPAGGPGRASGQAQQTEDILAELEAQRARHQLQLRLEGKARVELEEMLVRIERHFKNEQASRKRAEEQLQQVGGERDVLLAQLEAERAQQAMTLQQAMQERGMAEEQYQAQMAGLAAELEQTRQELAARAEAMGAELAAWHSSAQQARVELQERAQEIDSAGAKMRQLAELLASSAAAASSGPAAPGPAQGNSGRGGGGLLFHRTAAASNGGGTAVGGSPTRGAAKAAGNSAYGGSGSDGSATKRSPAGGERLPKLKTRAVPGAQLRQPDGGSAASGAIGSPGALPLLGGSPSSRGPQRERSGAGVGWNASKVAADRYSEGQRDAAMVNYMAQRWQGGGAAR